MNKPITIITFSLILGLAFNYLFYGALLGLNVPIFVLILLFACISLSFLYNRNIKISEWLLYAPILFFATMIAVRAGYFLTFLNVAAVIYLLLIIAESTQRERLVSFLDFIRPIFILPFSFLAHAAQAFREAGSRRKNLTKESKARQVFKGVLMALPILIIFTLLFASADLVVQTYLKQVFDFTISTEIIARALIVLLITILFVGVFRYIFQKGAKRESKSIALIERTIGSVETAVFLSLINALFLIFIIIQITYLFGGSQNITLEGFTYAEYARKGFFELLLVSLLTYFFIWASERSIKREKDRHSKAFIALAAGLVLQTLIILVSSHQRLSLYEQAFGFTQSRFYAHVIILWIAVMLIVFLYTIFNQRYVGILTRSTIITAIIFLIGINIINPDALIARNNIERAGQSEAHPLDIWYLSRLSDDAVPEIVGLLDEQQPINDGVQMSVARNLYWRRDRRLNSTWGNKWQAWNMARRRAGKLLEENRDMLEENKNYSPFPEDIFL